MNMQEKAIKAVERYLKLKGYEDVSEFEGFVIGMDDGERVICHVEVCEEEFGGFDMDELRPIAESVALRYLAQCEAVNVPLRFDEVKLIVVGGDRAMVRHHVNCLN